MEFRGTTILAVRKDGKCAIAGDGQVTLGETTIMKHTAVKVIKHTHLYKILCHAAHLFCHVKSHPFT